jgi:hypothetical protein
MAECRQILIRNSPAARSAPNTLKTTNGNQWIRVFRRVVFASVTGCFGHRIICGAIAMDSICDSSCPFVAQLHEPGGACSAGGTVEGHWALQADGRRILPAGAAVSVQPRFPALQGTDFRAASGPFRAGRFRSRTVRPTRFDTVESDRPCSARSNRRSSGWPKDNGQRRRHPDPRSADPAAG